jgi:hypothetical protein
MLFGREESQRVENCRSFYVRVGNRRDQQLSVDEFDNGPKSRCLTFRSVKDSRLHRSPFRPGFEPPLAGAFFYRLRLHVGSLPQLSSGIVVLGGFRQRFL